MRAITVRITFCLSLSKFQAYDTLELQTTRENALKKFDNPRKAIKMTFKVKPRVSCLLDLSLILTG